MARVSFVAALKQAGITAAWVVLYIAAGVLVTIAVSNFVPGLGGPDWFLARNGFYEVAGFLFATWLIGAVLAKRSWDQMGWRRAGALGFARHLAGGLGLGAVLAAVAVGLSLLVNGAALHRAGEPAPGVPSAVVPIAIGFVGSALGEELMFRGFPLRRVADAAGPWAATLILAACFAAMHLGNPAASALGTVNIFLAGVWFSVAFFSPGGMALAWGLHTGWNAGLALLFGVPVSGYALAASSVAYQAGTRAWVDGGPFGPEGGVVGTVAFLAGLAVLLRGRTLRPKEWFA